MHGGHLLSAASSRRFFVLTDDAIQWFENDRSLTRPKGDGSPSMGRVLSERVRRSASRLVAGVANGWC